MELLDLLIDLQCKYLFHLLILSFTVPILSRTMNTTYNNHINFSLYYKQELSLRQLLFHRTLINVQQLYYLSSDYSTIDDIIVR